MSAEAATLLTAKALSGASAEEEALLETLCRSEEERLERQLKQGVKRENCGEAFSCAAAALAAADLFLSRSAQGGVKSFRAGAVSIQAESAGQGQTHARELRDMARRMMEGFTRDGDVCLRGVNG